MDPTFNIILHQFGLKYPLISLNFYLKPVIFPEKSFSNEDFIGTKGILILFLSEIIFVYPARNHFIVGVVLMKLPGNLSILLNLAKFGCFKLRRAESEIE